MNARERWLRSNAVALTQAPDPWEGVVPRAVETSINGKRAVWSHAIADLWVEKMQGQSGRVISVNYYTPQPYVDEYNRGSDYEGFLYTVSTTNHGLQVRFVQWRPADVRT